MIKQPHYRPTVDQPKNLCQQHFVQVQRQTFETVLSENNHCGKAKISEYTPLAKEFSCKKQPFLFLSPTALNIKGIMITITYNHH